MRQRQVPSTYRIWHPEEGTFDGTKAQISLHLNISHHAVFLMLKGLLKPHGWEFVMQLTERRPVRYRFMHENGAEFIGNVQEAAEMFHVSSRTVHSIIHGQTKSGNVCGWFLIECLD